MPSKIGSLCFSFFLCVAFLGSAEAAEWKVHFWMKAFIPKTHQGRPDYIKKTTLGTWVVPAPTLPSLVDIGSLSGSCFVTENRDFYEDPTAPARVTTEFILIIKDRKLEIVKNAERDIVRIGETPNVTCITGQNLRPPEVDKSDSVSIGNIRSSGFTRVFFVKASSSNPFYRLAGLTVSPAIDYSFSLTYNYLDRKLYITGTTGYFPAFEAYYSINDGPVQTLLKRSPHGDSTASALADFNLGLNSQNFEGTIPLP